MKTELKITQYWEQCLAYGHYYIQNQKSNRKQAEWAVQSSIQTENEWQLRKMGRGLLLTKGKVHSRFQVTGVWGGELRSNWVRPGGKFWKKKLKGALNWVPNKTTGSSEYQREFNDYLPLAWRWENKGGPARSRWFTIRGSRIRGKGPPGRAGGRWHDDLAPSWAMRDKK